MMDTVSDKPKKKHPFLRRMAMYGVIIVVGGFGVLWYISRNQNSGSVVLEKTYTAYTNAIVQGNVPDIVLYMVNTDLQKQLDALSPENRTKAVELLKLLVPTQLKFGAQFIEGDHAFLRFEGNEPQATTNSPTTPHVYGTVFFKRQGSEWKIDHQTVQAYQSPIPDDLIKQNKDITPLLWTPQFHANHTASPADCIREKKWGGVCLESWAILRLDEAYCAKISDADDLNESLRSSCYETLATLLGDPTLCKHVQSSVGQAECEKSLVDVQAFKTINIARIDSDDDGLTDLQEIYFNTSITTRDTDGDGVPDGEEVQKDSNPLGDGKLGDHLSALLSPSPTPDAGLLPDLNP